MRRESFRWAVACAENVLKDRRRCSAACPVYRAVPNQPRDALEDAPITEPRVVASVVMDAPGDAVQVILWELEATAVAPVIEAVAGCRNVLLIDPCGRRMYSPCAVERTKDVLRQQHYRHKPCPNSHLQGITARQALRRVRDVGSHDAVVDDRLRVAFANLDRLDVLVPRDSQAGEARASFLEFVDT